MATRTYGFPGSERDLIGRGLIPADALDPDKSRLLLYFLLINGVGPTQIRQGYVPVFIAGFAKVDLVGTCQRLDDPQAPVWSKVQLANVEALGGGSLAWDEVEGRLAPHIHVTVGLKEHSATGHTSHLLDASVQFLTEITIVEVLTPRLTRRRNASLHDVPLLHFDGGAS